MYHGIPEGYYSLTEAFHFMGEDTFNFMNWDNFRWRDIADACTKYQILHEMTPHCYKDIGEQLSIFLDPVECYADYRAYITFTAVEATLCDLRAENYARGQRNWQIGELIGSAKPPQDLEKFMKYVFRFLLVAKKLSHMLKRNASFSVSIQDKRTEHIREIPKEWWESSDGSEGNQFTYDFFTGFGSCLFYKNTIAEPYKGFLLIEKKAFENYRRGDLSQSSPLQKRELARNLLNEVGVLRKKLSGQDNEPESWPSAYTTPEIEALKRVLNNYGISEENQPIVKTAMGYFQKECPGMSDNLAHALATVIRTSKVKKGGFPGSPLFQDHKPIKVSEK